MKPSRRGGAANEIVNKRVRAGAKGGIKAMAADVDWFERLTGFGGRGYSESKARLSARDGRLRVDGHDRRFGDGVLTLPSLGRAALPSSRPPPDRPAALGDR